jgi:hypothetical protein
MLEINYFYLVIYDPLSRFPPRLRVAASGAYAEASATACGARQGGKALLSAPSPVGEGRGVGENKKDNNFIHNCRY